MQRGSVSIPFSLYEGGETHGTGVRVALEAAVAAPVETLGRARGACAEVAVAAAPDAARLPVVGDVERDGLGGVLLPAGRLVGDGGADVEVGEELRGSPC